MVYDVNNPLSDKELDELAEKDFDLFLEYLDSKTEYLKTKTRPLNSHEIKKMAMLDSKLKGKEISDTEWENIKERGKQADKELKDRVFNEKTDI